MKYSFLALAIGTTAFFSSCKSKEPQMNQSAIDAKVDSLVAARLQDINLQAMEDLDRRMSIEVKAKADSIVQAAAAAQAAEPAPVQ